MKNLFNKIKQFITTHKTVSMIVFVIILLIGYWGYGKITNTKDEIRYVTKKVEKGTIISSITGTGQVSATSQIELKAKASGDIVYLSVKSGQKVNAGTLVAQQNTTEAKKAVRDAGINVLNAKLSLEKLKIQNSNENMSADLIKAYEDGFNSVSDAFLNLSTIITGLDNLLGYQNLSDNTARISGITATEYREKAETAYYVAKKSFEKSRNSFRLLDRNSKKEEIDSSINETYETVKLSADAIKNLNSYVNYMAEDSSRASDYTSYQDTLSEYTTTTNENLSSLSSIKTNIKNYKDAFVNTDLDIQSSELSVKQKENALEDAKEKLSDYFIYTPFSGTISSVNVERTDTVSSGTSVATLITEKKVAEISLNEVDVAKIKIGQEATLTFDAIPDLTIAGKVVEIDSIGAVSSGVVNYTVKINLDTNDERIKGGMSTSADITTDVKQDILVIPNSAVKSMPTQAGQNEQNYVETFDKEISDSTAKMQGFTSPIPPNRKRVTVGISNETMTEIISGLKEGDIIVIKTITGTTTTTSAPSLLNAVGGNRTGTGGATRALR